MHGQTAITTMASPSCQPKGSLTMRPRADAHPQQGDGGEHHHRPPEIEGTRVAGEETTLSHDQSDRSHRLEQDGVGSARQFGHHQSAPLELPSTKTPRLMGSALSQPAKNRVPHNIPTVMKEGQPSR